MYAVRNSSGKVVARFKTRAQAEACVRRTVKSPGMSPTGTRPRRRSAWRGPPPQIAEFKVLFVGNSLPPQTYMAGSEQEAVALAQKYRRQSRISRRKR